MPAGQQDPEYIVGPHDVLNITVWQQPSLSGRFRVEADGGFSFPLIGRVEANGLTAPAIETDLRDRLLKGYLRNPQVTVAVAEYQSQQIFVIGEVRTPGIITITGRMTLLEALARAGSLTESAGGELVVVRPAEGRMVEGPTLPGHDGATELLRVSVREVRSGTLSQNAILKKGDTVFIPRAEQIFVLGQVNRPGTMAMEKGMSVLQAISLAGGVTRLGSTGRIKIIRIVDGKKTEIKVGLDDVVQPGDTIMVHARLF